MTSLGPLGGRAEQRTTLVPGPGASVAMGCMAVIMALIGLGLYGGAADPTSWWSAPPLGLAALMGWGALSAFRTRQTWILDVRPEEFRLASRAIERSRVTKVRLRKDLAFDGVEIEFNDGGGVR